MILKSINNVEMIISLQTLAYSNSQFEPPILQMFKSHEVLISTTLDHHTILYTELTLIKQTLI